MANPLILSDPTTGKISGFNVYERNPHEHFSLVEDSIATRLEPIPILNLLLTEQTLNEQRNLPCFWKQNPLQEDSLLHQFQVNLPPIEKEEWLALCLFFEYWAKDGLRNKTLEVGTFIMFDEAEKRVFFIVPQQRVTAASVTWKDLSTKKASNLDGSIIQTVAEWNSKYKFVGYCHSHNTMALDTPSTVDDAQEVTDRPFGLHLLLSTFRWNEEGNVSFKTTFTAGCNNKRVTLDSSTIVPSLTDEELNEARSRLNFTELNKLVTIYTPVVRYSKGGWSGKSKTYGTSRNTYQPYVPNNSSRKKTRRWMDGVWCVKDKGQWIPENLLVDPYFDSDPSDLIDQAWADYFDSIDSDSPWPSDQLPDVMTSLENEIVIEDGDPDHLALLPGAVSEEDIEALELEFTTQNPPKRTIEKAEIGILEHQVEMLYLLNMPKDELLQIVNDCYDSQADTSEINEAKLNV